MKNTGRPSRIVLGICGLLFLLGSCASPTRPGASSATKPTVGLKVSLRAAKGSGPTYLADSDVTYIHVVAYNSLGQNAGSIDLTHNIAAGYWSGSLTLSNYGDYLFDAYVYYANYDLRYVGSKSVYVSSDLLGPGALTISVSGVTLNGGSVDGSTPGSYTQQVLCTPDDYVPEYLTTDGRYLYAVTSDGSILRIDIYTGSYKSIASGISQPEGIVYGGGSLYVSSGSSILKLAYNSSTSTWGSPTTLTTCLTLSAPERLTYSSPYLFVADSGVPGIAVINLLDPSTAASNKIITLTTNPYGIATDGTRLLVTAENTKAEIGVIYEAASISDPLSLTSSDFKTVDPGVDSPMAIATDGTNDYISDPSNGAVYEGFGTGVEGMGNVSISMPLGICSDGLNLYIAGESPNSIYMIEYPSESGG